MNDELERPAVPQSDGGEMTHIARGQTADAERLGQRNDRSVNEAQAEIRKTSIDFHRTRELADSWRRIGESASGDVMHEHLHRRPFVAQEVVDLGKHQARHITSPCPVNGIAEAPVIWRALDKVIDQRTGIADERGRATGRH